MKKPIYTLLALFACAFLPLYAADLSDLTWTTTDGQVTITDCDETATGELVIPDTIEGNTVTSIRGYTFRDCNLLTSITIPDSVTSIGGGLPRIVLHSTAHLEPKPLIAWLTADKTAQKKRILLA